MSSYDELTLLRLQLGRWHPEGAAHRPRRGGDASQRPAISAAVRRVYRNWMITERVKRRLRFRKVAP